jgi:hypothetical protein
MSETLITQGFQLVTTVITLWFTAKAARRARQTRDLLITGKTESKGKTMHAIGVNTSRRN